MRVAIVGAGISGLAAAHYLHREHEIFVFEKEDWVGGHACTVEVEDEQGNNIPLDVGFLVFNDKTYPLFSALLHEIGAPTQRSDMSLSVRCQRCRYEYATHSLKTMLGGSLARGLLHRHFRMLREILRFNKLAQSWLRQPNSWSNLGMFLMANRFSEDFFRHYLGPMTAAIWSAPPSHTLDFPLELLLRFLHNHGLLSVAGQPQWQTIRGGSREYVRRLVAPFAHRVQIRTPVRTIVRNPHGIEVYLDKEVVKVDAVVLAVHSDQALQILGQHASPAEREALTAIRYQANDITLHTDTRLLPSRLNLWASWNYSVRHCTAPSQPLTMTYWINRLQNLPTATSFLVSVNAQQQIHPTKILRRWRFHHPQYDPRVPKAQDTLRALNGHRNTLYAGAYLGYGFHEDGVRSALEAAEAIRRMRVAA